MAAHNSSEGKLNFQDAARILGISQSHAYRLYSKLKAKATSVDDGKDGD